MAGMPAEPAGACAVGVAGPGCVPWSVRLARCSRKRRSNGLTISPASTASSRYIDRASHRKPGQARTCWSQNGAPERSATRAVIARIQPPAIRTAPARRVRPGPRVVSRNRRRHTYQLAVTMTARTRLATSTKTMTTVSCLPIAL
ncbi:hypothetical protein A4E84_25090 [Streptomyces qaidamensis]|uniref:Uncharacterized protein n=1 Tax=Streptomyces qaidamensis TaxID=1783515 RepID=A0A143C4U7_9ACTN|nr:hypothetical protein A4E84_25090 [Streptomyces qaidamensis]